MTEAPSTNATNASTNPVLDALLPLTSNIVSSYVSNHVVQASDVPALIKSVYGALQSTGEQKSGFEAVEVEKQKPAVAIKKSVANDSITCLECGGSFKSLKRHLMTHHNQTPDEYRAKWNLAADYPMVAPEYATKRSELAKATGLGQSRRKAA